MLRHGRRRVPSMAGSRTGSGKGFGTPSPELMESCRIRRAAGILNVLDYRGPSGDPSPAPWSLAAWKKGGAARYHPRREQSGFH